MSRTLLLLVVALLAVSCTTQDPEIALEDQVPADQRPAETEQADDASPDAETVADLVFIGVDIAYEDPPTEAPAGLLGITMDNQGNLVHNVVFEGVEGDRVIAEAPGGETATGQVELSAGDYVFYCSIPGHRAAGMVGDLTVT
jgi:plastocyanin